jgi:xanthine dehydrogenase large subunit
MSVGKSIHHDSAVGHVTGKSIFVDDRAKLKNEVYVGVVGSPICAGAINKIEYADVLKMDGGHNCSRTTYFSI